MANVTRTVILTGGRAGQTCRLNHGRFQFTDGQLVLRGDGEQVAALMKILADQYQAFEKGSDELEAATNGEHNLSTTSEQPNPEPPLLGGDQSGGTRPSTEEALDGSGSDGTDEGPTGIHSEGPGHEDPRMDRIRVALAKLDHGKDADWTTEGLPKVKVVARKARLKDITRRDIDKAAPGLQREG